MSNSTPVVLSNHGLRHGGGIERYLLTLLGGLRARGIRPLVVVKSVDRALDEAGWADVITVPMALVPGKLRDLWFDRRLRALKARHGWFPLIALNQTAAADIAICGSNHPAHMAAMGMAMRRSDRWKIALERSHLERSRVILAHSALLAAQVQEHYGIDAAKIELAYPPVDTRRFHPVTAERRRALREQLGLPDDRAVFLLASTGHARKGLDLAVRALSRHDRSALLVVAGRRPDVQAPNLRYLGYRSDIEDVYRAVDCTLVTSHYEPFGLVGVESVLCGTPIIVAGQVGCAEVIRPPAALPFRIDQAGSLDAAVDAAIGRWRDGTLRLDDPRSALAYDPSVDTHLDLLLRWVARLVASR